ncbi:transposase [Chromobacterium sp. TRC.1.1.SA]|uniref:Transposase n=1 Tax=Chromobacterium indicum TaxID=3110228 RepID=A0ABV0CMH7_9NEIS
MSTQRFTPEFKEEAVKQVTERGYSVAEVFAWFGVSSHSLYKQVKTFTGLSLSPGFYCANYGLCLSARARDWVATSGRRTYPFLASWLRQVAHPLRAAAGYALRLAQAGFLIDISAICRQVLLAGLKQICATKPFLKINN